MRYLTDITYSTNLTMNSITLLVLVAAVYCLQASSLFSKHELSSTENDPAVGVSICILPSGERNSSVSDCTTGEVFLIGQYVNVGLHNVGSYGTTSTLDASYYSGQLGFIADYDRNGFASSSPGYAGDYFVPGFPLEGILRYSVRTVYSTVL